MLLFILFICPNFAIASENFNIENLFKKELYEEAEFTQVPRGLIISVEEDLLFDGCETEIKKSGQSILDRISYILKNLDNNCVVENHTQKVCSNKLENWELAMIRSGNIIEYMIKCNSVKPEQLFDIGYGEYMPFNEQVNPNAEKLNNRVDFVIINYEAKR